MEKWEYLLLAEKVVLNSRQTLIITTTLPSGEIKESKLEGHSKLIPTRMKIFNQLGNERWEFVDIDYEGLFYFKRLKE